MRVGVVVVTFNAQDVIARCLESLVSSTGADLSLIVIDNASTDGTLAEVRRWAAEGVAGDAQARAPIAVRMADGPLSVLAPGEAGLIASGENLGFAGGVNLGLRSVLALGLDAAWIVNPDCVAEPQTAATLVARAQAEPDFGMIGGRVYYDEPKLMIQSDGGNVNLWTGACRTFNLGRVGQDVPAPPAEALDYVSGAHMFVSRAYLERVGLMPEAYFLYYEEVEWCMRRGNMPLSFCAEAVVHHIAGHSVGSASLRRGPSRLSAYFMARSRVRFVARRRPLAAPISVGFCLGKAIQHFLRGRSAAGWATLRAVSGLGPDRDMLRVIGRKALPTGVRD